MHKRLAIENEEVSVHYNLIIIISITPLNTPRPVLINRRLCIALNAKGVCLMHKRLDSIVKAEMHQYFQVMDEKVVKELLEPINKVLIE